MTRALSFTVLFLGAIVANLPALPPSGKPVPPREAAAAMTVPPGFKATLFAGEPDVVQPIAFCFDDRGRLWVCECKSYPGWIKDGKPGEDRILVFEDRDNDGVFDQRTVFADKLANLTSIEYGFGGVYVLCAPNLLHIPIEPGTDRPAAPAKAVLDGFSLEVRHNMVNGLKWGPDGWLYGCHGIVATSKVGRPGTPDAERTPINCGVWRYHPVSHKFEVVATGTTNPWGIDWDEHGELYLTNCVIDHAFHVIPGGHYQRMYGQDFNPHLYKLMGSCVDHLHWAGGHWTSSRGGEGKHSEAGGGHAHVGCMVYQGENFPKEYRNCLFTCNLHGNRVNRDRIDNTARGPVLRHEKDFLFAHDSWFRGLAIDYGPDGGVYVSDWYDTGECHNYDVAHKTSGRIYKIVHGTSKVPVADLATLGDDDLLKLLNHTNGWLVRHARRLLQERFQSRPAAIRTALESQLRPGKGMNATPAFLAMAEVLGILERDTCLELATASPDPRIRALAVRSMLEHHPHDRQAIARLGQHARLEMDRGVRVRLASGLQRLRPDDRWDLARALTERADDANDPQIPFLLWYGIEPLPAIDIARAVALLETTKVSFVRESIARRIATLPDAKAARLGIDQLLERGGRHADGAVHIDVLRGLHAAYQGQRSAPMPAAWSDAYPAFQKSDRTDVRDSSLALAVTFGDTRALNQLRKLISDTGASVERRQSALQTLVFKKSDDVRGLLESALDDPALRAPAIRALAGFADDRVPSRLLALYAKVPAAEREDILQTLSSRPPFALALLDAVEKKVVDRRDLNSFTIRQIAALKNSQVKARLEQVWGAIRPATQEKKAVFAKYKALLAPEHTASADAALGRRVYTQHCAACHRLFGEGGAIGPDLTGSQRNNLDYVLENVLDPNAVVSREYQVTLITTASGRTLTGLLKEETERVVKLQTQNELVLVPTSEIEQRTASKLSMMPEGILERLPIEEARALITYLSRAEPLPK